MRHPSSKLLLPVVVFSQFAGTSLWFAGNAVINDLVPGSRGGLANITSVVQFGFIAGTLIFSIFSIADRFSAKRVFFFSSLLGGAANLMLIWTKGDVSSVMMLRFLTGFFLAGIYPVGMKIAAVHFPEKLGHAMGFLVGALVFGTAFPHILRSQLERLQWQSVLVFTTVLAFIGGFVILVLVPPSMQNRTANFKWNTAFAVFGSRPFRAAASGYFGHMWELYAFWAFVPFVLSRYNIIHENAVNVPVWSFMIIAVGGLGCIAGGYLSQKVGSKKVAFVSLLVSGVCCLFSVLMFGFTPGWFLLLLLIWGFTVVSDSPQFSTMVAQSAEDEKKGTALTIVTSVGFAITILSIQLLRFLSQEFSSAFMLVLAPGPILGLMALRNYFPARQAKYH